MSNLIIEVDSEYILLADGTRIEINMSYDEYGNGNPCGFIIREAVEQSFAPDWLPLTPEQVDEDLDALQKFMSGE